MWKLYDGTVVDTAGLKRMFMGKLPSPVTRRLLRITRIKKG
jgi:hypothetical protein